MERILLKTNIHLGDYKICHRVRKLLSICWMS